MFFSDPTVDMRVIAYFTGFFFVLSVLSYVWLRKLVWSVLLFSVLSNWVFFVGMDFNFSVMFNVPIFFNFVRHAWPYLNAGAVFFVILHSFYLRYARTQDR